MFENLTNFFNTQSTLVQIIIVAVVAYVVYMIYEKIIKEKFTLYSQPDVASGRVTLSNTQRPNLSRNQVINSFEGALLTVPQTISPGLVSVGRP